MPKRYIVALTDIERESCQAVLSKNKANSQKAKRAQILLQSDINGAAWTDTQIASAYHCRIKTVENVRQRLVKVGFEECLHGKKRAAPPVEKLLNGEQEARIIALRLGNPPAGYSNWSLRLLAGKAVELEICERVSHETIRKTLKKTK